MLAAKNASAVKRASRAARVAVPWQIRKLATKALGDGDGG
jgi:hypothetical protein